MSNTPLSDTEAQKLFNSVSNNLDNPDKLNEILGSTEVPEETPDPEVEEVKQEAVVEQEVETKLEENKTETQESEAQAQAAQPAAALTGEELERLIHENKLLQHKHRSESSRTAALQRKLNDMEARLASLSTTAAKPSPTAPATEEGEDPDLEDLKKTDPALYRIIKKREDSLRTQVESLKSTLTQELAPVKQAYAQQETTAEKHRLQQLVPNVTEVVRSDAFKTFVETASDGVRNLVMSKHADDVVAGLQVYSQWLQMNGLVSQPAQQEVAPAGTPVQNNLALERERKLQQAVTVKSPAVPQKKELSAEELFEQSYNRFHKLHGTH